MVPWFNSAFDSYQSGFRSLTRSVWSKALAAGMFDEYGGEQCCGHTKQSVSKSHSGLVSQHTFFMSTCSTLSGLIVLSASSSSSHFQKHQPWCHHTHLMITNKTWNALADLGNTGDAPPPPVGPDFGWIISCHPQYGKSWIRHWLLCIVRELESCTSSHLLLLNHFAVRMCVWMRIITN